jgi:hypothetical protein
VARIEEAGLEDCGRLRAVEACLGTCEEVAPTADGGSHIGEYVGRLGALESSFGTLPERDPFLDKRLRFLVGGRLDSLS